MQKTIFAITIVLLVLTSVFSCVFAEDLLSEEEVIAIAVKCLQELDELTTEEKEVRRL